MSEFVAKLKLDASDFSLKIDKAGESTSKLEKNLNDVSATAKKTESAFGGLVAKFKEGQDATANGGGLFGGLATTLGNLATPTGAITAALGGLTAGFAATISIGKEFEQNLAGVSAVTGISGAGLQDLGARARALAKDFGTTASDQLKSFQGVLSKFGATLADAPSELQKVSENINILAKAGGLTAAESMDTLANSMLQFGVNVADGKEAAAESARFMNVLAASARVGAAEIPQVGQAVLVTGVAAKQAKVSFEETNAAIQVLAAGGKVGAEAGTALRNVLGKIAGEDVIPKEALGKLKSLGVDMKKVSDTSTPLSERLKELGKASKDATAFAQVFGTENAAAAAILANGSDTIKDWTAQITGTSDANKQAAINMNTLGERMNRLKANVEDFAIGAFSVIGSALNSLIDVLAPIFTAIVNSVQTTFTNIYNVVAPIITTVGQIFGSVFAAMPVVFDAVVNAGSKVVGVISDLLPVIGAVAAIYVGTLAPAIYQTVAGWIASGVQAAAAGARYVASLIPALISTVAGYVSSGAAAIAAGASSVGAAVAAGAAWVVANAPLVAIGVAIGGVIYAFKLLYDKFEPFRNLVDSVLGFAVNKFKELGAWVGGIIESIGKFFGVSGKVEVKTEQATTTTTTEKKEETVSIAPAVKKEKEKAKSIADEIQKLKNEADSKARESSINLLEDDRQRAVLSEQKKTDDKLAEMARQRAKILQDAKITAAEKNAYVAASLKLEEQIKIESATSIDAINVKFDEKEKAAKDKLFEQQIKDQEKAAKEIIKNAEERREIEISLIKDKDKRELESKIFSLEKQRESEIEKARKVGADELAVKKKYDDEIAELRKNSIQGFEDDYVSTIRRVSGIYKDRFEDISKFIGDTLGDGADKFAAKAVDAINDVTDAYSQQLGILQKENDAKKKANDEADKNDTSAKDIQNLEKQLAKKKITLEEYNDQRAAIEAKGSTQRQSVDSQEDLQRRAAQATLNNELKKQLESQFGSHKKSANELSKFKLSTEKEQIAKLDELQDAREKLSAIDEKNRTKEQQARLAEIEDSMNNLADGGSTAFENIGISAGLAFGQALASGANAMDSLKQIVGDMVGQLLEVYVAPVILSFLSFLGPFALPAALGVVQLAKGLLTSALSGFSEGGYTGGAGVGDVVGLVHGQEFVMNAGVTSRERPLLEHLHKGGSSLDFIQQDNTELTLLRQEVSMLRRSVQQGGSWHSVKMEVAHDDSLSMRARDRRLTVTRARV